jgi:DNA-directed RNA polymerase specialized sigma24 family protein
MQIAEVGREGRVARRRHPGGAGWDALEQDLWTSVQAPEATREFGGFQAGSEVLVAFEDVSELVGYLRDVERGFAGKDAVVAALVGHARGDDARARLALALLWLGLWRQLSAVYTRRLSSFGSPTDAVAEIAEHFTRQVRTAELARICRLTATLVRNTERDVASCAAREWRAALHARDAVVVEDACAVGARGGALVPASFGLPAEEERAALGRWLGGIVRGDSELVLAFVVDGLSHDAVARRQGMSRENARKRYQRALGRIRAHLTQSRI